MERLSMPRFAFIVFILLVAACKNKPSIKEEPGVSEFEDLSGQFKEVKAPFYLTDTALLTNKDTSAISSFSTLALDSFSKEIFGKAKVKYSPLAHITVSKKEDYLIIKASSGNKKIAYLLPFVNGEVAGMLPFLIPDADKLSSQASTVDKSHSITKMVSRKDVNDAIVDRKEVYTYNVDAKKFDLILTDMYEDANADLLNPIDTFSKKHKFAGDYFMDKRNLVSVRDGRNTGQLMLFVHLEKNKGQCTGELKGEILLTASNAAVLRSDLCVIDLKFTPKGVTLKEKSGCGAKGEWIVCMMVHIQKLKV